MGLDFLPSRVFSVVDTLSQALSVPSPASSMGLSLSRREAGRKQHTPTPPPFRHDAPIQAWPGMQMDMDSHMESQADINPTKPEKTVCTGGSGIAVN